MTLSVAPITAYSGAPVPAQAGIGLKARHYLEIIETRPALGWFEVHPENYMGAGGPPHHYLTAIRENYPLSLHGVGMALGGDEPLDKAHLKRFRALVERYQPGLVSEHLAWCRRGGVYYNDLLPAPYTTATLNTITEHIDQMQTALGRTILVENPSTYVAFEDSAIPETEFLAEAARRTGCSLLLDVNNVYVSGVNQGYDPYAYIDAFALHAVGEIHMAGHLEESLIPSGRLLIDDHGSDIIEEVWNLYAYTIARTGPVPTLIERDNNIPALGDLLAEAARADQIMQSQNRRARAS